MRMDLRDSGIAHLYIVQSPNPSKSAYRQTITNPLMRQCGKANKGEYREICLHLKYLQNPPKLCSGQTLGLSRVNLGFSYGKLPVCPT